MSRAWMLSRIVTVWSAAAVWLVAACGVPAEDSPRPVEPPRGPYFAPSSAAPATPEPGAVTQRLYLVSKDRLVPVTRRVRVVPTVDAQLRDLVAGPSDVERDAGLGTALTGISVLGAVYGTDGVITVEVAAVEGSARSDEILAFGQIVCTLADRAGVTGVWFVQGGQRLGIPRADGSLSEGPLTAADYAALILPR